jgi:hypothetical protein
VLCQPLPSTASVPASTQRKFVLVRASDSNSGSDSNSASVYHPRTSRLHHSSNCTPSKLPMRSGA